MLVDVYRNLTKGCFSVKCADGPYSGKVIAHAESVWLDDPMFRIVESGRQRVLMEQKKYVHAYVRGDLYSLNGVYRIDPDMWKDIPKHYQSHPMADAMDGQGYGFTYNPYKFTKFVVPFMGNYVSLRSGHHALLCNEIGTRVLGPCFFSEDAYALVG
jgi:hypothetical protein